MKSIKIFTITANTYVDGDETTTAWDRAFASREEAVAAVEEDAREEWDFSGTKNPFPGLTLEDDQYVLSIETDSVTVCYTIKEVDLDLP